MSKASPELGPLIVHQRQERGWTIRELAIRAKMPESLLREIEHHGRSAAEDRLRELARLLGLHGDHVVLLAGKVPERLLAQGFTEVSAVAACACLSAPSPTP